MQHTAEQVLSEALALSLDQRGKVAASLIQSFDQHIDPDADEAWAAEIQRRLEGIDSGQVMLNPWHEARRIVRGDR